jgi:uncharacterized membrane protein
MKQHKIGARILAALLPMVCAAGFALPAAADLPAVLQNAALLSFSLMGSIRFRSTGSMRLQYLRKMCHG